MNDKISKKYFFTIWFSHTLLTISLKLFSFFAINVLLQKYITLSQFPLFGAACYIPTIILLWIVPRLMEQLSVIHSLRTCGTLILVVFMGLWIYCLVDELPLWILIVTFSCLIFLGSLETIFFDKFVSVRVASVDLPFAISWTRQANTLGYILGPLIGGYYYNKISFEHLIFLVALVAIFFRIYLIFFRTYDLVAFSAGGKIKVTPKYLHLFFSNLAGVFLFSLNFFWLNIVSIMLIPYFKSNFNVSEIGFLLGFAGIGLLIGNAVSSKAVKYYSFPTLYGASSTIILMSILFIAGFGDHYYLSCLSLFLGSMGGSIAYISAQYAVQNEISPDDLATFYGIRNFFNAMISFFLFILLWFFLSSHLGSSIKYYFHVNEHNLFSLFFFSLGILGLVCKGLIWFFSENREDRL